MGKRGGMIWVRGRDDMGKRGGMIWVRGEG